MRAIVWLSVALGLGLMAAPAAVQTVAPSNGVVEEIDPVATAAADHCVVVDCGERDMTERMHACLFEQDWQSCEEMILT